MWGSGLYCFCTSYSRSEKNSTDPSFPMCWINIKAVELRNSLKRGRRHRNDTDNFVEGAFRHLNAIRTDQWQSYRERWHGSIDERFVMSRVHRRTHTEAR